MKDFKEELKTNFIPRLREMIKKENEHIAYLNKMLKNHDNQWYLVDISEAETFLNHLKIRLTEYENYVKD